MAADHLPVRPYLYAGPLILAVLASVNVANGVQIPSYDTTLEARYTLGLYTDATACTSLAGVGSCAAGHDEQIAGVLGDPRIVEAEFATKGAMFGAQTRFNGTTSNLALSTLHAVGNVTAKINSLSLLGQYFVYYELGQSVELDIGSSNFFGPADSGGPTNISVNSFFVATPSSFPIISLRTGSTAGIGTITSRRSASAGAVMIWDFTEEPPGMLSLNRRQLLRMARKSLQNRGLESLTPPSTGNGSTPRLFENSLRGSQLGISNNYIGPQTTWHLENDMDPDPTPGLSSSLTSTSNTPEYVFVSEDIPISGFTIPDPLPVSGDDTFELEFEGTIHSLTAGEVFDFRPFSIDPGGVNGFYLRGFDIAEGLSVSEAFPYGFGLQFASEGMTSVYHGAVAVPEPSNICLALMALVGVAIVLRLPRRFLHKADQ